MPNWTSNFVSFCDEEDLEQKLDPFMSTNKDGTKYLDFNKIIPEPTTIEECDPAYVCKEKDERMYMENDSKPWFNWYLWRTDNWGTKWNCRNFEMVEDQCSFDTAWAPPFPIFQALANKLNHRIDVLYRNEGEWDEEKDDFIDYEETFYPENNEQNNEQ